MLARLLALVVCVAASHSAAAQVPLGDPAARRAALAGVVRDTVGRPLPFVTISADGRDLSTVTDATGRFHLGGIPAGRSAFTIMRIGYKAINFEATLSADSTILIDIRMRSTQTLPTVQVEGEREWARLSRDGFYERKRIGMGKYLTPEQADSLSHRVSTPAQLMRNMSGVRVACGQRERRQTGGCVVTGSAGGCMVLFIDGVFHRGQIDELLQPGAVFALEVYNRGTVVPIEFKRAETDRCGAVIVWTQSRNR